MPGCLNAFFVYVNVLVCVMHQVMFLRPLWAYTLQLPCTVARARTGGSRWGLPLSQVARCFELEV